MHLFILLTIVVLTNSSALNLGSKVNKFEFPPSTTTRANKEREEEFTPNIYPDNDKLLAKKDQCIVIRQFKIIEGQELLDRLLQTKFKSIRYLIVDEYSMVGCELLKRIDSRLRQAKGQPHELFGGISILLCGDFKQLPPVADTCLWFTDVEYLVYRYCSTKI